MYFKKKFISIRYFNEFKKKWNNFKYYGIDDCIF